MYNITFIPNKNRKMPIYEQLYMHIADEIRSGRIAKGERLPSKKALSTHLKVSVNTVETAYAILVDEGYIQSRPRSGYFAMQVEKPMLHEVKEQKRNEVRLEEKAKSYAIDFKTNAADMNSFPYATWVRLSKEVMYAKPELLNIGDFRGDLELRESIAKYLHEFRGVQCRAENIVIGSGIEYLLTLLTLLLPNRRYAVENPGYAKAERIFENSTNAVNYIPVDSGGMSVEALRMTNSEVVYITPSHQFPTGTVMPIGRRMELLAWAQQQPGRYIIEDDYNGEFNFGIRPTPAVQGLAEDSKVIYLSTFSRTLAPSIRISYMVLPPELMRDYETRFNRYTCTVPRFEQHTLNQFIEGGYFPRHLNRIKNIYRKRCDVLYEVLRSSGGQISGEKAGLHLLLKTPYARKLLNAAEESGIKLYHLDNYFFAPPEKSTDTLIIGYAGCSEEDIRALEQVVRTL